MGSRGLRVAAGVRGSAVRTSPFQLFILLIRGDGYASVKRRGVKITFHQNNNLHIKSYYTVKKW